MSDTPKLTDAVRGDSCPPPCSACEELRREVAHLMTEKVKLHAECQKYRVALNRVAHPATWGVNPGHHVEIARRALVIGMSVDPLPESAKIIPPNN